MEWFNSEEKKKKMEFIQSYVPTSKAQLLQVSMMLNKGDVQKAQEMFDFYNKNLELPDFDPVMPTVMQQIKSNASDLFSWIKENQGDLVQYYEIIRSIVQKKGVIEPAADSAGTAATDALPPINE